MVHRWGRRLYFSAGSVAAGLTMLCPAGFAYTECLTGTNPTIAASVLRITAKSFNGNPTATKAITVPAGASAGSSAW